MPGEWLYLPILKWKQGERIALRELRPVQWSGIVPLLEMPSIKAAPDAHALREELPAYTAKIGTELARGIPENKPVAVDIRWMAPAYHIQARLLLTVCRMLSKARACIGQPRRKIRRPLIPRARQARSRQHCRHGASLIGTSGDKTSTQFASPLKQQ